MSLTMICYESFDGALCYGAQLQSLHLTGDEKLFLITPGNAANGRNGQLGAPIGNDVMAQEVAEIVGDKCLQGFALSDVLPYI